MAVSLIIEVKQNSQNVANNTSSVTVKVNAKWTNGLYNLSAKSGVCTINGTPYVFTSPFNTGKTSSGSCTLYTKTLTIKHDADGKKELSVSASYTGDSSGTVSASTKVALPAIPLKSTLTVGNGTLGTPQALKITEVVDSMVHKLTYKCGSVSGYILGSSSATSTALSTNWTPPFDLARQNTTGTSVSITFYLYTYNGTTLVGTNTYTKTFAIPINHQDFLPSSNTSVEDATGTSLKIGSLVQGLSKLKVNITALGRYGATIKSIKTTFDGKSYTGASFTTNIISASGSLPLTITLVDSRGVSSSATFYYDVMHYFKPSLWDINITRCEDEEGNGTSGGYLKLRFSSTIVDLNNKNTASYELEYQAIGTNTPTKIPLSKFEGQYDIANGEYIFPADVSSAYIVTLTIKDTFDTTTRIVTAKKGATSFKLWSILKHGLGICFGKVATLEKTVEFAMAAKFNEPVYGNVFGLNKLPEIPAESDLNTYMETGCWAVYRNDVASTIANIPVPKAGRLEVSSATGEGTRDAQWSYLRQRYIPYNSSDAIYEREIVRNESNVWSYFNWWQSSLTPDAAKKVYRDPKVLWQGGAYMQKDQVINLNEAVSKQPNGIVLVFSRYSPDTTTVNDHNFSYHFVPKTMINNYLGNGTSGSTFAMTTSAQEYFASKYLYFTDTTIKGHENNIASGTGANGIKYSNEYFVLRYVIGV